MYQKQPMTIFGRPAAPAAVLACTLLCGMLATTRVTAEPRLHFDASPLHGAGMALQQPTRQPPAPDTAYPGNGLATGLATGLNQYATPILPAAIDDYREHIHELELEAGPYAPALGEEYLALGHLLQQAGKPEAALAEYARAEHNSRVNFGLKSAEQLLPIRLSIEVHLAQGDYQQALERQEYLLHLQQARHGRDAAELAPELARLGDMYFAAFERGLHERASGSGLVPRPDQVPGIPDPDRLTSLELAFLWLHQAQRHYFRSIGNLVANRQFSNPLLPGLENKLIGTLLLQAHRRELELDPVFFLSARDTGRRDTLQFDAQQQKMPPYREGAKAFTRMLSYLQHDPSATPLQVAEAMLELGDWHLLFGRHRQARKQYEEAREWLQLQELGNEEISALLAPAVPVQLPSFITGSNLAAATGEPDYEGYIDVALELDENGRLTDLAILDKSATVDSLVEDRLVKTLRNAPFRPVLAHSGTSGSRYELRYRFARM